jgi:hypothetical protein
VRISWGSLPTIPSRRRYAPISSSRLQKKPCRAFGFPCLPFTILAHQESGTPTRWPPVYIHRHEDFVDNSVVLSSHSGS